MCLDYLFHSFVTKYIIDRKQKLRLVYDCSLPPKKRLKKNRSKFSSFCKVMEFLKWICYRFTYYASIPDKSTGYDFMLCLFLLTAPFVSLPSHSSPRRWPLIFFLSLLMVRVQPLKVTDPFPSTPPENQRIRRPDFSWVKCLGIRRTKRTEFASKCG